MEKEKKKEGKEKKMSLAVNHYKTLPNSVKREIKSKFLDKFNISERTFQNRIYGRKLSQIELKWLANEMNRFADN